MIYRVFYKGIEVGSYDRPLIVGQPFSLGEVNYQVKFIADNLVEVDEYVLPFKATLDRRPHRHTMR